MWAIRVVAVALIAALGACGSDAAQGGESTPARKPAEFGNATEFPQGYAGGETGSFTPSACGWVSAPAPIEADDAAALGFPVTQLVERLERDVDAPLRWTTEQGTWTTSGHDRDTHVRAKFRAARFAHYRPSEQWCDETTCQRGDAEPVERASCGDDSLFYYLETQLQTADGAIDFAATCLGAIWRHQLEEFATGEEATGADCYTEVLGGMRITDVERPYVTVLSTHFLFESDHTSGSIYGWIKHSDEPMAEKSPPAERLSLGGRANRPIAGKWPQP